ncbi:hypothetical protein LG634_06105 [Streptomyces bambusae]|uniref:hypothetical protein n=1 Tax=Streptomyces bambusae TaxID=1550616 RepID=UPI001CFF3466|nr:hypothetical protein [Streptomyces bambusae]MCB5164407.1 hypothetical protein [Streptomyces bambusae]
MRKSLMAALATVTATTAVLLAGPVTSASAASPFCNQTPPSTSIFFYRSDNGNAGTGTLSAGQWQFKASLNLPPGYTHGAASRDSLLLYNKDTGAGEIGTFTNGRYARVGTYGFAQGWTHIEASGDSVIFYKSNGYGVTGTLKNGAFQQVRVYNNFSSGWGTMAASCDTLVAAARQGGTDFPWSKVGYGTLTDGVYTHEGSIPRDDFLGELTATKDSVLSWARAGEGLEIRVSKATEGTGISFNQIGTSGVWNKVGRTSDSLFFYKTDGTAWTSTLVNGSYTNVGPLAQVSSGWTLIEGGV